MPLKSTPRRYGAIAIALHWTTAAAIALLFAAGLAATNAGPDREGPILIAHISLGLLAVGLTLARVAWWLFADHRPQPPEGQPLWQRRVATAVHFSLYAAILVMGASGIATLILSGTVPMILSGQPVPDLSQLAPRITHGLLSRVMLGLLALHIGAALYHQFVRRDDLLARMGVPVGRANKKAGQLARP